MNLLVFSDMRNELRKLERIREEVLEIVCIEIMIFIKGNSINIKSIYI